MASSSASNSAEPASPFSASFRVDGQAHVLKLHVAILPWLDRPRLIPLGDRLAASIMSAPTAPHASSTTLPGGG